MFPLCLYFGKKDRKVQRSQFCFVCFFVLFSRRIVCPITIGHKAGKRFCLSASCAKERLHCLPPHTRRFKQILNGLGRIVKPDRPVVSGNGSPSGL